MITLARRCAIQLILLILCLPISAFEQRLKIEGVWEDGVITAHRLKQRDASKDASRVRVNGTAIGINHQARQVTVGPMQFRWGKVQDHLMVGLKSGDGVEISATQTDEGYYEIVNVKATILPHANTLELIGAVYDQRTENGQTFLTIGGVQVRVPANLYSNGKVRLRRLDDKRPSDQLQFHVGDINFTLGGEFELKAGSRFNQNLDGNDDDDEADFEQQVQLELFAQLDTQSSAFIELKLENELEYEIPLNRTDSTTQMRLGEAWYYVDEPFGLPISFQAGRQNFAEQREWWWDDDLDAIRVYYSSDQVEAQLALAEPILADELGDSVIDADEDDIFRVLAMAKKRFNSGLTVTFFYLHQNDHSSTTAIGEVVSEEDEDDEDSQLNWFGTRLTGELVADDKREVSYWLDAAYVRGHETTFDFDDFNAQETVSVGVTEQSRKGWALDSGISYTWRTDREPTLTLGYAIGSGAGGSDGTFRETGLNDNNNKFNGIDRFRYYGELTRPELSNVGISTISFGMRPTNSSSIELIHHTYRQQETSPNHTLRIDQDANGRSKNLGQEINFVSGIESWEHVEIEITTGYFLPGDAFDTSDNAWLFNFKFNYNF